MFSMREYRAFLTASADHVSVAWLALAGGPLSQRDRSELERLLDEFFRKTGDRSFQQHAGTK